MTARTLWFPSLGLAGLLQCGLATYHVVLPSQMGWTNAPGLENA